MTIEKLTERDRDRLDQKGERKALRIIDAQAAEIERLQVDRYEWVQVSRDWRIRAESAEARVRELKERLPEATELIHDDGDSSPLCRCEECPSGGPFTCIGGEDYQGDWDSEEVRKADHDLEEWKDRRSEKSP